MLSLHNLSLRRGPNLLLSGVDFTVHVGQRVGVVGRNGSGKSSLFGLLLGELGADSGALRLPPALTVATVRQETPAGPRPAIEYVLDGDTELRALERDLVSAEARGDGAAQARLHERMHGIGGYAARARAGRLLHGLGFTPPMQESPIDVLSGGWRMRLNLAQALMCRADLMLLDEPSNHLDLDAVLWLQDHLARFPGTLLVISHDRDFLDATTGHTLHLEDRGATLYSGNYSAFEASRAERLGQQQARYENQRRRLAQMEAFIERFRAKAGKARQAQSRLKQIERMPLAAPAHWDTPFSFAFAAPPRLPPWLLQLDHASAGYRPADQPPVTVVAGLNASIAPGDRIALVGRNGAGKSTLMRLLAGASAPLAGSQQRDPGLQVGYFAQHQIEQLDPAASPLAHLQRLAPRVGEQTLRDFLGGFDFRGNQALAPVAPFSGGEKARLALALVVYRRPNLLLLDEPTNHLDLELRHALELALQDFAGAVVLIAHDRHLVDTVCDALWLIADGRCAPFNGDLDDYASWLRRPGAATGDHWPRPPTPGPGNPKAQRQAAAARRRRAQPLRGELKHLEDSLARRQRELARLDGQLADPDLYHRVAELTRRQGRLRKDIESAEQAWLELAQRLEAVSGAD